MSWGSLLNKILGRSGIKVDDNDINVENALDYYESIISKDEQTEEFCKDRISWIQNKRVDVKEGKIRVGIVGVTSSGKSTLINAILGYDILTRGVVPTSSQLVCCSYGDEAKVIVHFDEGKKDVILAGKNFVSSELQKYSDERWNKRNEKKVKAIEVFSPKFALGKDVLLIDSPGLDAYGLDIHEKITMETLIPSIDICLYVTTMKADSDSKTKAVLDVISNYHCSLLIVQNMLDSVQGSPNGKKSKNEVAKEHRLRVQKIIDNSEVQDTNSVQIVQISAINALNYKVSDNTHKCKEIENKYLESNFTIMCEMVDKFLEKQRPIIEASRIQSILDSAKELADEIEPEVVEEVVKETSFKYDDLLEDIHQYTENEYLEMNSFLSKMEKTFQEEYMRVNDSLNKKNAEDMIKHANDVLENYGNQAYKIIQKWNQYVRSVAVRLGISESRSLSNTSIVCSNSITIRTKVVPTSYRKEKKGLFPRVARLAGKIFNNDNWGYENVPGTDTVTDIKTTKEECQRKIESSLIKYTDSLENYWDRTIEPSLSVFLEDVEARKIEFLRRKDAQIEQERKNTLYHSLKKFCSVMWKYIDGKTFDLDYGQTNSDIESNVSIEVNDLWETSTRFAEQVLKEQHVSCMKCFVQKEHLGDFEPLLLGWDDNCMERFKWYAGITFNKNCCINVQHKGIRIPSSLKNKKKCIFVLVNTVQFGAAKVKISLLKNERIFDENDFVVWIVQDFEELLNSKNPKEGLENMLSLSEFCGLAKGKSIVWIIHNNPLYNMAFLEKQYLGAGLKIDDVSSQTKYYHELFDNFKEYADPMTIKNIAHYIMKVNIGGNY